MCTAIPSRHLWDEIPQRIRRIEEAVEMLLVEKFSREVDPPIHSGPQAGHHDSVTSVRPHERDGKQVLRDSATSSPSVTRLDADRVRITVDETEYEFQPSTVAKLKDDIAAALTFRREFVRTTGKHRSDGSYVVRRRGSDSCGHRKVFTSFDSLVDLFKSLPQRFSAADVDREGISGSRRYLVVWHLVEHPHFDCRLVSRQPLTAVRNCRGK